MKFGLPEESDDEEFTSFQLSYASDEEDEVLSEAETSKQRLSSLGRTIRAFLESSDEESESEDDSKPDIKGTPSNKVISHFARLIKAEVPADLMKDVNLNPTKRKSKRPLTKQEELLRELEADEPDTYDAWLRATEKAAMRTGHQRANERRNELQEVTFNARTDVQAQAEDKVLRDIEEMAKMVESMAIKNARIERETTASFKQRQTRLWDEIDAAIREVERQEAEVRAAALALIRKKHEEEAARIAAEEKAALTRKAEAERLAKEKQAKQKAEEEAKAAKDKTEAEARAAEQAKQAAVNQRPAVVQPLAGGSGEANWKKWVDKQKWMKREVIEPVKKDRAARTALRPGMRLITRGLGQVVNTKEGIVRVTNDIHSILCEQLVSPPNPANPTLLSHPPPTTYSYLLSHLSKALIKQAESEVSANADAAYPLGRIVIGLLLRGHAAFGEVLFARLVKKCPWVVPFYPGKHPDQSREEYEKSTGRGTDESLTDYIARMVGIVTLYFAILQTPIASLVPTLPTQPSPDQLDILIDPSLRFSTSWTWMASVVKGSLPALPPTAGLIAAWISLIGAEARRVWGPGQVAKIFEAIKREGVDGGKIKGDGEAARQKLGIDLDKAGNLQVSKARDWET